MLESRVLQTLLSVEVRSGHSKPKTTVCITYGGLQVAIEEAVHPLHQTWESSRLANLLDRVIKHAEETPTDTLCICFADDGWEEMRMVSAATGAGEYRLLIFATQTKDESK